MQTEIPSKYTRLALNNTNYPCFSLILADKLTCIYSSWSKWTLRSFIMTVMNQSLLFCSLFSCSFFFQESQTNTGSENSHWGQNAGRGKPHKMETIQRKFNKQGAEVILLGNSTIKNTVRFAPNYFIFFPRFQGVKTLVFPVTLCRHFFRGASHVFSFDCYLHFSSLWNQQSFF